MKTPLRSNVRVPIALAVLTGAVGLSLQAAPEPYSVDPDTLHLWHFDEAQNTNTTLPEVIAQDVSAQTFYDLYVTNGAKLEGPAFSVALGGSLDTRGIPGAPPYEPGAFGEEELHWYPDDFAGPNGAFTFEALVSPDFDPATPDVSRPNMQILSLENEGGTDVRVFQFRLASNATNEQWSLEFENIGSAAAGSNAPITTTLIDDFSGDVSAYDDVVILDTDIPGGSNGYVWEIALGSLQIRTTNYQSIEQYALTRTDHSLPVGQQLVCDYLAYNLGSQDIGLYVGDGTPVGSPSVRSNYVTVYVRNDGAIYTRGFDGTTEYNLLSGGAPANIDYLFIDRIGTNVFQTGYYDAGVRNIIATRTNTVGGIGSSVGIYADVRAAGTRGNVDNLRLATNFLAVPPADPEVFTVLLPTNGSHAAYPDEWYHVAVAYNGSEDTANNLSFYWTSLSNSPGSANLLAQFRMTNDLGSASGGATIEADFTVGNEGRDAPGESFQGLIDEVRISDVARSAGAFNLNGSPYTTDGNTRLLYHFDESTGDFPVSLVNYAFDEVTVNSLDCDVRNGATFGEAAFAGFGTAMRVSPTTSSNNFPLNDAAGAYGNVVNLPFDPNFGSAETGFTFEALIRPDFDPASTNQYMQIISGDGDGGVEERGWQFKFEERPEAADLANPLRLEFIRIAGGILQVYADVPTAGAHAITQSNWYHVAVTFNGDTNDGSNLHFYWTALDSGATEANLIATTNLTVPVQGTAIDFSIGNEDRDTGGNSDAFIGAIDEVRISKVARAADAFLLVPQVFQPEITAVSVAGGQVTLTWTSQAGASYAIDQTTDLGAGGGGFGPVLTGIDGNAPTTTTNVPVSGAGIGLYRVRVE